MNDTNDILNDLIELNETLSSQNRKIIRRLEHLSKQQELTNNILIEMARADSKEDLNNRLDSLIAMQEV